MEVLSFEFMQRAYLGGLIVGVLAPLIGVLLVLRRLSLTADTLSHVSLAGVTLGGLLGIYPLWTSILFAVIGVIVMEVLIRSYKTYAELSIAILMATGLGLSVVFLGLMRNSTVNVMSYLFGSLVAINWTDIYVMATLLVITSLFLWRWGRSMLMLAFDEETARVQGIPVTVLQITYSLLVAFIISSAMRMVGVLLVSSLIVLPVAISLQIARSYTLTYIVSILVAEVALMSGLTVSFYANLAPGGTIVLLLVLILVVTLIFRSFRKKRALMT